MIKRILVGLSGSEYTDSAIQHAINVATRHQATITGVADLDLVRLGDVGPVPIGGGAAAHELREFRLQEATAKLEESVAKFKRACEQANVHGSVIRETGDPVEHLTSLWRYHDLTILGFRGIFDYGVLDDTSDELIDIIHNGVRPVLAVAPTPRPLRRIMIAYNGAAEAAKAMKQFMQLDLVQPELIAVVAVDEDRDRAGLVLKDAARYVEEHTRAAVQTAIVPSGKHTDGILEYADSHGMDLIVLGATNRWRLVGLMMGDTAKGVLKRSQIPVFITQ